MRTNYNVTVQERKALVKTIAEFLGETATYMGMPSASYQIGSFTVTKDGTLEFSDRTDSEIVEGLCDAVAEAGFSFEAPAESLADVNTAPTEDAEAEPTEEAGPAVPGLTEGEGGLTISFPLDGHTGTSLRNLINMVFSRGRLISKATGGTFSCMEGLSDVLLDDNCVQTTDSLRKAVADYESVNGTALRGISFSGETVSFTGFPFCEDLDRIRAFTQLACQMNNLAKEQKRSLARVADDSNERYIFRIWLLRLGMTGAEYKVTRKLLLSHLTGSAAFKDQAMEDRWKANQAAKQASNPTGAPENGAEETE